ncbi:MULTISPECIES: hypothetical protein [unclassified Rhodococcus (in: high G+C Gram-positive bacteria)]|uniref:hypothetical protein n=1 Tax=unclassified Rhodococcus (in: high G+C Gram-positive bacteria) TaxID=192944 RepID=UPI001639CFD2|nr:MULTISPECIES: hypothetical protein [unclassified Rhodococcus (in: high G+C Gram-positive bacteria)]MBC2638097.1 hypothetical protein [Rhodococcus sp. 3A]
MEDDFVLGFQAAEQSADMRRATKDVVPFIRPVQRALVLGLRMTGRQCEQADFPESEFVGQALLLVRLRALHDARITGGSARAP